MESILKKLIATTLGLFFALVVTGEEVSTSQDAMVLVEGGVLSTDNPLDGEEVETFRIARTPVTWKEWKSVRGWAVENGYDLEEVGEGCESNHPVHSVNWYDVVKWSNAKSEKEGLTPVYEVEGETYREGEVIPKRILVAEGYRLPSETEWEYAARGGRKSKGFTYSGSDVLDEVGWYDGNSGGSACDLVKGHGVWPVGEKSANELGLYDMSGNLWEWCWDQWSESNQKHSMRGGSWLYGKNVANVSARVRSDPQTRDPYRGFRLATNAELPE